MEKKEILGFIFGFILSIVIFYAILMICVGLEEFFSLSGGFFETFLLGWGSRLITLIINLSLIFIYFNKKRGFSWGG